MPIGAAGFSSKSIGGLDSLVPQRSSPLQCTALSTQVSGHRAQRGASALDPRIRYFVSAALLAGPGARPAGRLEDSFCFGRIRLAATGEYGSIRLLSKIQERCDA